MPNIIDKIKSKISIEDVLNHYGIQLTENKKILCKVTGEKTPSCTFTNNGRFYCFSCGGKGDVIDFIAHEEQCDIPTAIKIGIKIAGLGDVSLSPEEEREIEERKRKRAEEKAIADERLKQVVAANRPIASKFCEDCAKNIGQTDYFTKRGFTEETQKRFRLGYEPLKKVVIIPYNAKGTYFCTRSVEEKRFWKPHSYFKCKPNGEYDFIKTDWILGEEPIFNGAVLLQEGIVVVCESQIDAISLLQAGMKACAIGGTSGIKKLEAIRNKIKAYMLFGFDNDEAGQKAATEATALFWSNTIRPLGAYKDWNEWLMARPDEFMTQVGGLAKIFNK